jgi:drug/metabolite transporter (DMT)-like permease
MNRTIFTPRFKADLTLLLVAVVWGSGFVAQRLGADNMSALYFNGARFLLGGLILLAVGRFRWRMERRYLPLAGLAGVLLFAGSGLQQAAIETTTIGNVAFITGLYVVAVPLLLFGLWRERTRPRLLAAALMAVAGVALLSLQNTFQVRLGDALALLGAVLWAGHVVLLSRLPAGVNSYNFAIAQFLACAALDIAAGLIFNPAGVVRIALAWPAVIYAAAFPTAVGFTLQIFGQRQAPAVDAAIVLSLETVFGALFGFLIFGEGFSPRQLLGCGLILAAMVLCQVWSINNRDEPPGKRI